MISMKEKAQYQLSKQVACWSVVLVLLTFILAACNSLFSSFELGDTRVQSSDGAVLVYVPGGTFQMGSTTEEAETAFSQCEQYTYFPCGPAMLSHFLYETPAHSVTLDSFWIYKTEVTLSQYNLCVQDGHCEEAYCTMDELDYPMRCVDLLSARDYCAWAGGRLPTEAEWEYAARGPESYIYPWGNTFECDRGNFGKSDVCSDELYWVAPVGLFPEGASWCGALDMAGNVWEWVNDWPSRYPSEPQINPVGTPRPGLGPSFDNAGLRGGGFRDNPMYLRMTFRRISESDVDCDDCGFRCVVDEE